VEIRPGEYQRTLYLFLYLLLVLLAYYILKPVSRALFLNKFDANHLPWLYLATAAAGGILAFFYGKLAVRTSLARAVAVSTIFVLVSLVSIWLLLAPDRPWMYYLFNVWVSLFSLILVSQGWLIASQVFHAREAKRVYGILATGSVLGAAIGGSLTAALVKTTGTNNLVLVSGIFVILAYTCFHLLNRLPEVDLRNARGAQPEEAGFEVSDVWAATVRYSHLRVIIGIICVTYLVDTLVDFQFNTMARAALRGDALTAFLGGFYGLTLNLVTFVLQVFLTTAVVKRFGVGGTLLVLPVGIGIGSLFMLSAPGVLAASILRLVEASTRYSFNRTGMELLYLPLPGGLKERTKAFVDVFVDRLARGLGALVLLLLGSWSSDIRHVALVVVFFCILWIALAGHARREYVASVKGRLAARRLDLESVRTPVEDPGVIRLLEETAQSDSPRQVRYALAELEQAPGYRLGPLLSRLAESRNPDILAQVFQTGARLRIPGLEQSAGQVLTRNEPASAGAAAAYLALESPNPAEILNRAWRAGDPVMAGAAIEALEASTAEFHPPDPMSFVLTAAQSTNARQRQVAALAARFSTPAVTGILAGLIRDPDPEVQKAAIRSAAVVRWGGLVEALLACLGHRGIRREARLALAAYGDLVLPRLIEIGTGSGPTTIPRNQALRVLSLSGTQSAADALLQLLDSRDINLRWLALRHLERMRKQHPNLNYASSHWSGPVHSELRWYHDLAAATHVLEGISAPGPALLLLRRTLESRAKLTIDLLFRMLGLKYPPKDMDAALRAVRSGGAEEVSNALEFLDNILEHDLKGSLLPVLDDLSGGEAVQAHFRLNGEDLPAVLRKLLQSGDRWLTACSIMVAGDLKCRELAGEISSAGSRLGEEVRVVAGQALEAMD